MTSYYADGASRTRYTCDCGASVLSDSWQRHREMYHNETRRGRVKITFTRIEVECDSLDDAARLLANAARLR